MSDDDEDDNGLSGTICQLVVESKKMKRRRPTPSSTNDTSSKTDESRTHSDYSSSSPIGSQDDKERSPTGRRKRPTGTGYAGQTLQSDFLPGGKFFRDDRFVDLVPFAVEFDTPDEALMSYNETGLWHKVQFKILSRSKNDAGVPHGFSLCCIKRGGVRTPSSNSAKQVTQGL